MKLITIEGNIGSGKSTLLKILKEKYKNNKKIVFINEPLLEWQNMKDENGKSILENFYSDNETYSFAFQIYAFNTILNNLLVEYKKNPKAIFISERGIVSTKKVFAKMLYDNKKINQIMYNIYNHACDFVFNNISLISKIRHTIIYVDTDPEVCLERINKRARAGEESIKIDYLNLCKKYHDDMITNMKETYEESDIYYFNGNIDYNIETNCYDNVIKFINDYLEKEKSESDKKLKMILNEKRKGNSFDIWNSFTENQLMVLLNNPGATKTCLQCNTSNVPIEYMCMTHCYECSKTFDKLIMQSF